MVEVLAIETGDEGEFCPEERLPDPTDIMVVCSSLISYNTVSDDSDDDNEDNDNDTTTNLSNNEVEQSRANQIQLAHFSVKEYLLSDRCAFWSEFQTLACQQQITEGCLRYLLYLRRHAPLTREIVGQYPLARYAGKYWWQHAQEIDGMLGCVVLDLTSGLLVDEDGALLSWVQLYDADRPWRDLNESLLGSEVAQPLYYAASVGVSEVVKQILVDARAEVNAQGGQYGNALQAASWHGHEKVVQMLLSAGADVNAQGGEYGNALQTASWHSDEKVVQMLLSAGADVNAQGGKYGNALQAALRHGHEKVVQMLLSAGADVNAQGGEYGNALQCRGGCQCSRRRVWQCTADGIKLW